ncbi:MAG: DUF2232 domain-containing protein [Clostridia bacterium]|nr:DUF2232 domain-containing protein [Clostridia bacterium]
MKDFPLFRSARSGLAGLAIMVFPLIIFSLSSASAPLALMLTVMVLPAAACISGLVCGALPMAAGIMSGIFSMYLLAGPQGAQTAAVYLIPVLVAFIVVIVRRIPFWKGCAVMIGAHVAAMAGAYLMIQGFAGGQLFTLAGDWAADYLSKAEEGDQMLYVFYQYGLISLPEEMKETLLVPAAEGGYMMNAAARADLILSMRSLVNSLLATLVPTLLISQSILGGVACLALPLKYGAVAAQRRDFKQVIDDQKELQAPDFPDLSMPPVSLWHIPRGMGWKVGVCWLLGNFLQGAASAPAAIAGIILYAGSSALFTIQGISMINFLQKAKGSKKAWRIILPLLLYMVSLLSIVGIFDQITNLRGLRKPRQPKEE